MTVSFNAYGEYMGHTAVDDDPHADYPHEPGMLYDCPACESECFCEALGYPMERYPGSGMCVHCAVLSEGLKR